MKFSLLPSFIVATLFSLALMPSAEAKTPTIAITYEGNGSTSSSSTQEEGFSCFRNTLAAIQNPTSVSWKISYPKFALKVGTQLAKTTLTTSAGDSYTQRTYVNSCEFNQPSCDAGQTCVRDPLICNFRQNVEFPGGELEGTKGNTTNLVTSGPKKGQFFVTLFTNNMQSICNNIAFLDKSYNESYQQPFAIRLLLTPAAGGKVKTTKLSSPINKPATCMKGVSSFSSCSINPNFNRSVTIKGPYTAKLVAIK